MRAHSQWTWPQDPFDSRWYDGIPAADLPTSTTHPCRLLRQNTQEQQRTAKQSDNRAPQRTRAGQRRCRRTMPLRRLLTELLLLLVLLCYVSVPLRLCCVCASHALTTAA
jgi:hypothetical protein